MEEHSPVSAVVRKFFKGGWGGETEVPRIKGGGKIMPPPPPPKCIPDCWSVNGSKV